MPGILVIDNDSYSRLLIRQQLMNLRYESFEANNSIQGIQLALQARPDAILLDAMMPVQDGYEICARLRAEGYTGEIILMSTLSRHSQLEKARAAGADDYLQKPLSREILKVQLDNGAFQER